MCDNQINISTENGTLFSSCPCGWKYRGTDRDEMERMYDLHDPGDSCCNCGGVLCMDCTTSQPHTTCTWDCPDCCLPDNDGYTTMDRQRQTARWWAVAKDTESLDAPELTAYLAAFHAAHPNQRSQIFLHEETVEYLHDIITNYRKTRTK